jgi:polyphenol oxidase
MPVPLITAPLFSGVPGLVHGFSTRDGGVSLGPFASLNLGVRSGDDPGAVRDNYRRLSATTGIPLGAFRAARQVHGAEVLVADGRAVGTDPLDGFDGLPEADALLTDRAPALILVRVADCFPVLLLDEAHHAVGVCHAGWRGTLAGVVPKAIRAMREGYGTDPSGLRLAVGPGIGRGGFRVSPDVARLFESAEGALPGEVLRDASSARVDLAAVNIRMARNEGVPPEGIWSSGACTFSQVDRFFSFRRDGRPFGQMVGFIGWSS